MNPENATIYVMGITVRSVENNQSIITVSLSTRKYKRFTTL